MHATRPRIAHGRRGPSVREPRSSTRVPLHGREHLCGRHAPAGGPYEQGAHRVGQAQRVSQQPGGVLAGSTVDSPLQVTDRPRTQPRRPRQCLLRHPGLGPQLPQQPGEPLRRPLRHGPGILLAEPHHSGTRRFGMARKGPAQRLPRPGCPHHLPPAFAPGSAMDKCCPSRRHPAASTTPILWILLWACMCGGHPRTSATVELAGGRTSAHTAGHHGPSRTNRRGCRRSGRSLLQVSERT